MAGEGQTTYYTKDDTSGEYVEAKLPSFNEQIPEDIREHFKDYGDAGALATAFHNMKSQQPQIPETPEGYELPEIPQDLPIDKEAVTGFRSLAHELKLAPDAVKKIVEFDVARGQKIAEQYEQQREQARQELKTEWGAEYDGNLEIASRGLKTILAQVAGGSEQAEEKLKAGGYLDDPAIIRVFHIVGKAVSEDSFKQGGRPPGPTQGRDPITGEPVLDYSKVDR